MIGKVIEAKRLGAPSAYLRALANYLATGSREDRERLERLAGVSVHGPQPSRDLMREMGIDLSDYISGIRADAEKVEFKGMVNTTAQDWRSAVSEIDDVLKRRKPTVKKPLRHVVLSHRAGEHPTEAQCAVQVGILLEELGIPSALALWSKHQDTDNDHIHVLILTVDPDTGQSTGFGGNRSWLAIQRALARIDHAQGWASEAGAVYEMIAGTLVERDRDPDRPKPKVGQYALRYERESGTRSLENFAREHVAPLLEEPGITWQRIHERLEPLGLTIAPKHRGGAVWADERHSVSLSTLDRKLSWDRITRDDRLGRYEPPPQKNACPYVPQIIDQAAAARYVGFKRDEATAKTDVDAVISALKALRDEAIDRVHTAVAEIVGTLARKDARTFAAGLVRPDRDTVLGHIHAAFETRVAALRQLKHAASSSFTSWVPGSLRFERASQAGMGLMPARAMEPWVRAESQRLAGFRAVEQGTTVHYFAIDDASERPRPMIVDAGRVIWVNEVTEASVRAALTLGRDRFGAVAVFGDPAFLATCTRVARQMDLDMTIIAPPTLPGKPARRPQYWERIRLPDEKALGLNPNPDIEQHIDQRQSPRTPRRPPDGFER